MSRPCIKCGKPHNMGLSNTETGSFEPIDVCYDCLFDRTHIALTTPVVLEEFGGTLYANIDGKMRNLADYLNKQQAKLINEMRKNSTTPLHAIECDCDECKDKWKRIDGNDQ